MDWKMIDVRYRRAAKARATCEAEEIDAMIEALRANVHQRLGFGSFYEYVESVSDVGGRALMDRVRVAERLDELPAIRAAMVVGDIVVSAARELIRVAVPETEARWLIAARGHSVRDIEKLVSGHRQGDLPDDEPDPQAIRRVIALELSAAGAAVFAELRKQVAAAVGHRVDDDALIGELARAYALAAAGGSQDEGAARYQIAVSICGECQRATQDGGGKVVPLDAAQLSQALCDAEWIDDHGKITQDIPRPTRRAVKRRDHHKCVVPGCRNAVFIDTHHKRYRSRGGKHVLANLMSLCSPRSARSATPARCRRARSRRSSTLTVG